jgi:hypothetical protein
MTVRWRAVAFARRVSAVTPGLVVFACAVLALAGAGPLDRASWLVQQRAARALAARGDGAGAAAAWARAAERGNAYDVDLIAARIEEARAWQAAGRRDRAAATWSSLLERYGAHPGVALHAPLGLAECGGTPFREALARIPGDSTARLLRAAAGAHQRGERERLRPWARAFFAALSPDEGRRAAAKAADTLEADGDADAAALLRAMSP